jgi:hypothetical protein
MQHHFDVNLAVEFGVTEAILLNHFDYWIELNRANEKNFYDGRYWTFNSMKAFCEIFPYLSEKKIRNALKHLQDLGLILTGNFNKSAYDRTLWYAFSDLAESMLPKGQMDVPKKSNGCSRKGEPIPDDNTPNETEEKHISKIFEDRFSRFWSVYPKKKSKNSAFKAWMKIKPSEEFTEKIIKAVQKQKLWPEWQKDGGQFIPYPATWLNSGGWDDESSSGNNVPEKLDSPKPTKPKYRIEVDPDTGEEVVVWLK